MTSQSVLAGFAEAFAQERYADALAHIDRLIAAYADSPALRWNRVECLEKLGRYGEIKAELDLLLRLEPDHVPAIVKRVQYAHFGEDDGPKGESLSDAERNRREREIAKRTRQDSLDAEDELRRALMLDPDRVDALLLLANELREREDWALYEGEAEALLDHAIELAPERPDLLEIRANWRRGAATPQGDAPSNSGTRDSRAEPEMLRNDLRVAVDRIEHQLIKHDGEFKLLKWMLGVLIAGMLVLISKVFFTG